MLSCRRTQPTTQSDWHKACLIKNRGGENSAYTYEDATFCAPPSPNPKSFLGERP